MIAAQWLSTHLGTRGSGVRIPPAAELFSFLSFVNIFLQ